MKSLLMLSILLVLCAASYGDKSYGDSFNSYNSPPSGYGPPPPIYHPKKKCHPEKCHDAITITNVDLRPTSTSVILTQITTQSPPRTKTFTNIDARDVTHTKRDCESKPTTIFNVEFDTTDETLTIHECIPTSHVKTITHFIPRSTPVIVNHCEPTQFEKTIQSFSLTEVKHTEPVLTYTKTTKEWTNFNPTSSTTMIYACTEALKCGHKKGGYGHHTGYNPNKGGYGHHTGYNPSPYH